MMHKYRIIGNTLEQRIVDGIYKPNEKLPTEEALMQEFSVSRNTIRKALEQIIQRGYVLSIQGSGVYVRGSLMLNAINMENFSGLSRNHENSEITSKIIEFSECDATEELAIEMNCSVGTRLYFVKRVRIVDGFPWVIEHSYFNKAMVTYLNTDIITGSIYTYLKKALNVEAYFIDRIIEDVALDKNEAALLDLNLGDPAIKTTNKSMMKNGEIFDYSIDIHNYKYARFLKFSRPL